MSNTPSDAELVAVMRDGYNCRYNDEQDHIDFARAVLAKWGTPQPAPAPLSDDVVKDAARYRWLAEHPNEWRLYRKHGNHKMPFRMMRDGDPWGQSFTSADEAIDAARKQGGKV